MKWSATFGVMLALGSVTATAARAQESAAPGEATGRDVHVAQSQSAPDRTSGEDSKTVDANGAPVAKPNPMSAFLERARQLGNEPVEMPLVDDFRTDGTGTDGHTK